MPTITNKYDVDSIELFGSFVRNQQQADSDLDILVTFSKVPSLIIFIELNNYLSDELKVNVDLVMKDSFKPRVGKNILSEAVYV